MTEQYMDQYKKETAQVHAPTELIEKTKAAVRREEKRVLRERAAHKWAYPLTAAAALLILFSVSATMKGLKKSGSGMDGTAYEESAQTDAGAAEGAALESDAGAGASAELMDEGASADFAAEAEEAAETEMAMEFADETVAEMDTAGVENAESAEDGALSPVNDTQRPLAETKKAQSTSRDMAQDTEDMEATKGSLEDKMEREEAAAEDLAGTDSLKESAATENIIIEETAKRPAFCGLPDTEAHVFRGKTFLVRKEKEGWEAYVEAGGGTGYVLRGEAENLDAFLEAGYEKLGQTIMEE